jgi:hypothetical protein
MKIRLKMVKEPDLSELGIPDIDDDVMTALRPIIINATKEVIKRAMSSEVNALFYFAMDYDELDENGLPIKDPSAMRISLVLGNDDDNEAVWDINFREAINDLIQGPQHPLRGGFIEAEDRPPLVAVAAMLRECADKIDEALAAPDVPQSS